MPNEQPMQQSARGVAITTPPRNDGEHLSLRAAQSYDYELQFQLYAGIRAQEMALMTEWNAAQREAFLRFQHKAQQRRYRQRYPHARYDIVCRCEQGIGRLFVDARDDVLELIDITLLAPYRGQGIGTTLLRALLAEALQENKRVQLQVEADNPAIALYQRLGFTPAGLVSFYQILHWRPECHHLYHHLASR